MFRTLVKSKIQRLTITDKNLKYEGSLALDRRLLSAADILPGEMVQVVNVNNGARFETYTIAARSGSGACVLNGAAARLGEIGDEVIVMSTAIVEAAAARKHRMILVNVVGGNRVRRDCADTGGR
jgi:aspartate 1-decarboxylase